MFLIKLAPEMPPQFETIHAGSDDTLVSQLTGSRDAVALSTHSGMPQTRLLDECVRILKFGGLLFVYGQPQELALWGEHLSKLRDDSQQMIFKYWIALDIDDTPRAEVLKPTHLGLMMFWKNHPVGKTPAKFRLDTDAARVPHLNCAACGRTLKDWGGKKHLMNPKGAALSDVWRDLPRREIRDNVIPTDVLERIGKLARMDGGSYLHVIQETAGRADNPLPAVEETSAKERRARSDAPYQKIEPNQVLQTDCLSFLDQVAESHSEGLFDLAFADPPYNLQKLYGSYDDTLAEQNYLEWCNRWLAGMARALKPGGSLLVLNLPKWAIHHAAFLNRELEFRHWIAWDALSDPRGKLMPAHYALLWFTKPGAKPRGEIVPAPDAPKYCLRASCINQRKARGDDEKVELSDVWFDIHRIKHKRDRDAHPCQLPEKLMERIIKLTTKPGDWVFDPFCGAGTTAIAATRLGRNFVVTDVDENYVRVTKEKLAAMRKNADLFGCLVVSRESQKKPRRAATKREVELYLQKLARKLGRVPNESDIVTDNMAMLAKMDAIYSSRRAALKRAKVALADLL